jgi:hypothetical protein
MTASEQKRIEFLARDYLRNAAMILTEMELRPYKELMPMMKSQVDLENSLIHVSDSKTWNGIGDMAMTELARNAFNFNSFGSLIYSIRLITMFAPTRTDTVRRSPTYP